MISARWVGVKACILAALLTVPCIAEERATGSGTGFLINSDGWLATAAHVVEKCTKVTVSGLGETIAQQVDIQNDLAVIRVANSPARINPLSIRGSPARLGEEVAALGYPLSDVLSDTIKITTGNINSLVGVANDTRYLQISTPIQPGNSGGPLVDRAGNVVGINTATLGTKYAAETGILPQNVNFAIRVSVLGLFLEARAVPYQAATSAEVPLSTADLAEKVSPSVFQVLCYQGVSEPAIGSAPAPNVPLSPPSPETKAAAFVVRYHEAWSNDNATALAFMQSAYGDSVKFYGKTVSKKVLMAEKVKFAERWPIRAYSVRPESLTVNCRGTLCHVEAIVDWSASSPARHKASKGAASFSLDWDSTLEIITSETGRVIKADRRASEPTALIAKWHNENGLCRGGSGDSAATYEACERREAISEILYAAGWCYGKKDEYGYQMKWHRCTANSNR